MDDKEQTDPIRSEFSAESTWRLCDDSYFFVTDKESSILSQFGWSMPPDTAEPSSGDAALDRIDAGESSDLAGKNPAPESDAARVDPTWNPSVSSGSSEDPPENSTASGGKPPPPETAAKVRKKGQKRIRQQRFAFMTKSEVDHLEDGYRWRKYGQKAVKNSPYPRSYYRCTNTKCTVKKRVERSYEDPTIVITTYEGQHCHHTVGFPRGGLMISGHEASSFAGQLNPQFYFQGAGQFNQEGSHTLTQPQQSQSRSHQHQVSNEGESHFLPSESTASGPPTDEGLLGDMVPPGMRNQ